MYVQTSIYDGSALAGVTLFEIFSREYPYQREVPLRKAKYTPDPVTVTVLVLSTTYRWYKQHEPHPVSMGVFDLCDGLHVR